MNNGLFLQKLKICTHPLNSYYSFRKPNYLEAFLEKGKSLYEKEDKEKKKEEVLRDIFEEIREGFYTTKLDSLKLIANIHWNKIEINKYRREAYKSEDYYYDICEKLGNKYLYVKNGQLFIDGISRSNKDNKAELEIGENYNHKFQWYLLKHMMDIDTLIGAFLISNNFKHKDDMALWDAPIFTTDTLLETMLDKGVAELHMHVGATKRFSSLWMWMMNDITTSKPKGKKDNVLKQIKILTYEGEVIFEHYIKAAKVMRLVMATYLMSEKIKDFSGFVKNLDEEIDSGTKLHMLLMKFNNGERLDEFIMHYKEKINELKQYFNLKYETVNRSSEMKDKSNYLHNLILSEDILTYVFDDFYKYDKNNQCIEPLYKFKGVLLPEKVFIFKCMDYINTCRIEGIKLEKIEAFQKCFWQYIKIKNTIYKYIVQQHTGGKGLDIFTKIYKRQSSIKLSNFAEEAFYSQIKNQNIKKLEIRMGFEKDKIKVKKFLADIFRVYKNILRSNDLMGLKSKSLPLLGIVFHFNKTEDTIMDGKCIYNYNMNNNPRNLYFGSIENNYLEQAKVIAEIRREIKNIDNYIVGIDAASKENATEPFVFKKAYKELRRNDYTKNGNHSEGTFVKEIGYTFHVGEEYREIISGLRHVDEVIDELEFKAGDRLGHAIVLGIDIDKWAEINPVVYVHSEEYLDNLLWEWGLYNHDEEYKNIENISFLENKILDAVEYIFGFSDGLRVRDLYNSYKNKLKRNCDFENEKEKPCRLKYFTIRKYKELETYPENSKELEELDIDEVQWTPNLIYQAINCEYFLREMKKTVTININRNTIEKYKKLQQYMKKKVSDIGIIIEINPTSNLLIGDFTTFEDYHITNLSSPEKEDAIITINTDDPVIFNTRINNEYALIYDILMREGNYSSKEIINWLDKVRKNGIEYSFIKDRGLSKESIEEEIYEIIKELEK